MVAMSQKKHLSHFEYVDFSLQFSILWEFLQNWFIDAGFSHSTGVQVPVSMGRSDPSCAGWRYWAPNSPTSGMAMSLLAHTNQILVGSLQQLVSTCFNHFSTNVG